MTTREEYLRNTYDVPILGSMSFDVNQEEFGQFDNASVIKWDIYSIYEGRCIALQFAGKVRLA